MKLGSHSHWVGVGTESPPTDAPESQPTGERLAADPIVISVEAVVVMATTRTYRLRTRAVTRSTRAVAVSRVRVEELAHLGGIAALVGGGT
jgi:hypothetical protein